MVAENGEARRKQDLIDEIVGLSGPIYEHVLLAHADAWRKITLTMVQFKVLAVVAVHRRLDSPYLIQHLGVLPSTLTRVVDKLVARGLVRREENPRDRRIVDLVVTEAGSALVHGIIKYALPGHTAAALRGLSEEDLHAVRDGYRAMVKAITGLQQPGAER